MTDNEIITALKCCEGRNGISYCDECPLYEVMNGCKHLLLHETLDLISRQKAEIEKIKYNLKYYLENNEENGVVYIPKFVIDNLELLKGGADDA